MKTCRACGLRKSLTEFHLKTANPDGRRDDCKACALEKARRYRETNAERVAASRMRWLQANKERARELERRWHQNNPDWRRSRYRADYERRYAKLAIKWAARRMWCSQATPAWADMEKIEGIYRQAGRMRKAGFDVHVDHIVPLRGEQVCGLHVHNNLRIIPATDNLVKGNRLEHAV